MSTIRILLLESAVQFSYLIKDIEIQPLQLFPELSIRKLGHENNLLRTSLRRRRDSNPTPLGASSMPPDIFISDHSNRSSVSSPACSAPTFPATISTAAVSCDERAIGVEETNKSGINEKEAPVNDGNYDSTHETNEQAKLVSTQ